METGVGMGPALTAAHRNRLSDHPGKRCLLCVQYVNARAGKGRAH